VPLPNLSFTVLDTETTGFIPRTNRVIEFASVRVDTGKIIDRYEELFAIPKNDVPPVIQVLTRIRPAALEGKPTFEECKEQILEKIGEDTMIVGQNVSFDIKMLKGEGMDLSDRPWIDTSMLASLVFRVTRCRT
jgi:DNA polymerase-3 subunit epsilon